MRAPGRAGVVAVLIILTVGAAGVRGQQPDPDDKDLARRAKQAREITKTMAERLKATLVAALKRDGPVLAIGTCSIAAPEIAARLSEESGFEVGRTALKVRNPDSAPDAWELAVLERFAKDIASGADAHKLEYYAVATTSEGQKLFRYMRPIVTGEPCLACHGTDIRADVRTEILRNYPEDKAIGFALGEMRGAFSLLQHID